VTEQQNKHAVANARINQMMTELDELSKVYYSATEVVERCKHRMSILRTQIHGERTALKLDDDLESKT